MTKWIKMKMKEFKRLTKSLKECLAANKKLNEQNDEYNRMRNR